MRKPLEIIDDIHHDRNIYYYVWENSEQGTYFGTVFDVINFGIGDGYVFYNNRIKWCENLDIKNCDVSITDENEIQFIDRDNNCLIIGLKDTDKIEQYLID